MALFKKTLSMVPFIFWFFNSTLMNLCQRYNGYIRKPLVNKTTIVVWFKLSNNTKNLGFLILLLNLLDCRGRWLGMLMKSIDLALMIIVIG